MMWRKELMWRRLRNAFHSVGTYRDLSPDLRSRRRVRRWLSERPLLSLEEQYDADWRPLGVQPAIVQFARRHLTQYSGLPFGKLRPTDRLEADLSWTAVCGFDWKLRLCEDFERCFQLRWHAYADAFDSVTLADLLHLVQAAASAPEPQDAAEIDRLPERPL